MLFFLARHVAARTVRWKGSTQGPVEEQWWQQFTAAEEDVNTCAHCAHCGKNGHWQKDMTHSMTFNDTSSAKLVRTLQNPFFGRKWNN